MDMEILVRKARKEDFESLVNLRLELLKYENSLNSENKFNESRIEKSRELISTYLKRKNSVFFVAEDVESNHLIAYIHGTKDENPDELEGYIQGLFVEYNYRNQGVGKLLIDALKKWFDGKKHGLTTDKNNKLSLSFYKKHGYEIVEKEKQGKHENDKNKSDVVFMISD